MKTIKKTLLNALSTLVAAVIVALIFIVPITTLIGCIKLLMMMLGG